jgi:hypothetical protein
MWQRGILLLILISFCAACARVPKHIEPVIHTPPHPKEIQRERRNFLSLPSDFSVSPFSPLLPEECAADWGKEYKIALCFAQDFDLYRAITGFKRALCLIPPEVMERKLELEYMVALAYFLGQKYVEAVYQIESTGLVRSDPSFAAFQDLLLILYESYGQLGKCEHAAHILKLIEENAPCQAEKLALLSAVKQADFDLLCRQAEDNSKRTYLNKIVSGYNKEAKSVRKAQILNAVFPGWGYWYVGLRQTAITAFVINSLFIGAAACFFVNDNTPAALITLSLEGGWYLGGISGAGFAAKQYNEHLYCSFADKIAQRERYFPLMMLRYTF